VNFGKPSLGFAESVLELDVRFETKDRPPTQHQLFKRIQSGSLMSLGSQQEPHSSSLYLYIAASASRNVDFTIDSTREFATRNNELRALNDGVCSGFSTGLEDVQRAFTHNPAVVTAGGYLALLCSISSPMFNQLSYVQSALLCSISSPMFNQLSYVQSLGSMRRRISASME
jgi:hypothetical protein